eukprot:gene4864-6883_t
MADTPNATTLVLDVGAHAKLKREKAVALLLSSIKSGTISVSDVFPSIMNFLMSSDTWEQTHGALLALKTLCSEGFINQPPDEPTLQRLTELLTHHEFRVRREAGTYIGTLCATFGTDNIYAGHIEGVIRHCIVDNLERKIDQEEVSTLKQKLGMDKNIPDGAVFYESAGWKTLETGYKALLDVISNSGEMFCKYVTMDLIDIVFSGLKHMNRFVRETGYYACAELIKIIKTDTADPMHQGVSYSEFTHAMAQQLAIGLSDNWSQVRMASSVATRCFFMGMQEETRKEFFPLLIPRMCLNRYYVAEGVKLYSQESWRIVSNGNGIQLVETYIGSV